MQDLIENKYQQARRYLSGLRLSLSCIFAPSEKAGVILDAIIAASGIEHLDLISEVLSEKLGSTVSHYPQANLVFGDIDDSKQQAYGQVVSSLKSKMADFGDDRKFVGVFVGALISESDTQTVIQLLDMVELLKQVNDRHELNLKLVSGPIAAQLS